jgi:ornithine cyclodeaminase/alanine dehydrogenase-like protein (mu-crystallin family)
MFENRKSLDEDAQLKTLLRLEEEPCVYINEMQAHHAIMEGCNEFMDRLLLFYHAWSKAEVRVEVPKKQVFSQADVQGDFRLMPCIMSDDGLKFVKVIGTNEEERIVKDKICVGKSLLLDYFDNHVYAVIDVCALSSFRTAAVSILAMHLNLEDIKTVGLVGMGRIGFYTAYILYRWLGVRSFVATDSSKFSRNNFETLCALYMPDATIEVQTLDGVTGKCDALFLSTTSPVPFLSVSNGAHLQFISSVGADADNLSELDASLLQTHRVITDSLNSMCLGDMKRWQNEGNLDPSLVTELRALIQEPKGEQKKVLFVSTGIAVQDVLINRFVFEKVGNIDCSRSTRARNNWQARV